MGGALLDAELLERFESSLRAAGIPAVDGLMAGLTDWQIDEIVGPVGLQLPEEVRAWWRWRNGGPPRHYTPLLPFRQMTSLQIAVAEYTARLRPEAGFYGDPERCLQPVSELPAVFVQCVGSGDIPASIYTVNDWADAPKLVLASFGELVLTWIEYIERGIYAVGADGPWGWHDTQNYPPDVRALGIA
jgi:hypothetical protein